MKIINIIDCFPLSEATGTRGPLPKQAEFMSAAFDKTGPKYLGYIGGIGSGKTVVGCAIVLTWAIMYPGDYLVARQYAPELKITTLKQFLEICPPEVIDEYRVADGIIRIKASGGKVSNIIFRQLEEPDKLRSLNLSGFYIDESSQVSEAAFMLLQGRLRGPGLRKGILTSNPNGHDWIFSWFVKQDMFNTEDAKKQFKLVRAPSTENIHLPDGYVQSMMQTWSPERIKREIEGSFDAFEGMVYNEFRRDVHVIQPFVVPKEWTKIIGADHGYRNPAAFLWGAVDYDDNIYIYREFYEREWLIEEICKGNKKLNKPGIIQLSKGERIENCVIDPSINQVKGQTGYTDYEVYKDNLPQDFPMQFADNSKTTGIDRVKSYMKINPKTGKPRLFIFNTCVNLIDELSKYRYKELRHTQVGKSAEKEEPMKVDDHANDALRYMLMSRPEAPDHKDEVWSRVKYNSLEGALIRDLQEKKNPKKYKDPWGED